MRDMVINKYLKLWFPVITLHALHQLEESICFFQWYIDNAHKIPDWLLIQTTENAQMAVENPEYFILASVAQIVFVSILAFAFRRRENITRVLIVVYILVLSFFLIWHIAVSYAASSYSPVMVTCIGGLYLIPKWIYKLFVLH